MLLVTERPGTAPAAIRAGLRDRIMVRVRAVTLDGDLARGMPPEASTRLALRAQQLVRMRSRRELARSIQRILADAARPDASRWPPAPVRRDGVRASAAELRTLAGLLLSPAPLAAQGVAQARVLLSDGSGPLYRHGSRDDLRDQVAEAVRSLDPLAGW